MKREEGSFAGGDDLPLFYRAWMPTEMPRAVVVVAHGFGEHGGRYGGLAATLVGRGFAVYAPDHRGHGRSGGPRGHVDRWGRYRQDLGLFLRRIVAAGPAGRLFLFGHSMGALVVLDHALRRPDGLAGVVSSAAVLEPAGVAKRHLVALARLLTRVAPRLPMRLPLDETALSRDPAVVAAYRADPLVHDRATVRWGTESLRAIAWIKRHAPGLAVPILIVHGGADRVASPVGSRDLFEAIGHSDKTLEIYPDVYHEPHHDLGREAAIATLVRWLEAHAGVDTGGT